MHRLLILKYMEKLTKEDIIKFAINENVSLSNYELDLIYAYIKKYPQRILDNPLEIIEEIKDDLSKDIYDKLLELYLKYKNKIS